MKTPEPIWLPVTIAKTDQNPIFRDINFLISLPEDRHENTLKKFSKYVEERYMWL